MTERPPRRYKEGDELDGDEILARIQAERRGEPAPRFETDDYRRARREHLEAGGFEADDPAEEKPLEEKTAEDFFRERRRDAA